MTHSRGQPWRVKMQKLQVPGEAAIARVGARDCWLHPGRGLGRLRRTPSKQTGPCQVYAWRGPWDLGGFDGVPGRWLAEGALEGIKGGSLWIPTSPAPARCPILKLTG